MEIKGKYCKDCNVLWMIKPVINIKSTDEGE